MCIVLAQDRLEDNEDLFVMWITGTMDDAVHSASEGHLLRTQGDLEDKPGRSINEYWYFQRYGDRWLVRNITKNHLQALSALSEVSIDEETLAGIYGDGVEFETALRNALAGKRLMSFARNVVAGSIGLLIAVVGYGLYFFVFRAIWGAIA